MLLNLYWKFNLDPLELPKLSNALHVNFGRLNLQDKELSIIICIKCSRFGPSNPTLPHSISSCWRSAIIFRVKDSIISRPRSSGCCWHHLYCLALRCATSSIQQLLSIQKRSKLSFSSGERLKTHTFTPHLSKELSRGSRTPSFVLHLNYWYVETSHSSPPVINYASF